MRTAILVLAASGVLGAGEPTSREKFLKELGKVYNYLPADVEQSVRDAKSKEMDDFWTFVASDLDTYMPLLREALKDEKQNLFFCFDGSALLLEHSKTKADGELAVEAASRCRMTDISAEGYFYFCHRLCKLDVDAYPVVAKILEEPKFTFYVVQHALKVGQKDALLLCIACMGEERWVARFVERLKVEKDPTATRSILFSLGFAATAEADTALKVFSARKDVPDDQKALADALLVKSKPNLPTRKVASKREDLDRFLKKCEEDGRVPYDTPDLEDDAKALVRKKDEASIRAARRKVARRVSDEALEELEYLTELLRCAIASKE